MSGEEMNIGWTTLIFVYRTPFVFDINHKRDSLQKSSPGRVVQYPVNHSGNPLDTGL